MSPLNSCTYRASQQNPDPKLQNKNGLIYDFFYHFSLKQLKERSSPRNNFVGTHGLYVTLSFENFLVRGHSITTWTKKGGREMAVGSPWCSGGKG